MVTASRTRVAELIDAIRDASKLLSLGEISIDLCGEAVLSDAELEELQANCDNVRIERTAEGVLRVGGAVGDMSDHIEDRLRDQIKAWIATHGEGRTFGSGAGAYLPSGASLTPDLSWRPDSQIAPSGDYEAWSAPRYGAAPFVVEVQSRNQSAPYLRRKMQEWIDGGSQLGWLLLPLQRQVEIYRPDREPEILVDPVTLSGEGVMPGLVVSMSDVWI